MTVAKALSLYIDLDLSETKYNILRKTVNKLHPNCLPSLYALRNEKLKLIPKIIATEDSAEVDLKSIMQRTAEGIIEQSHIEDAVTKLTLICKWGHSRYKQKFEKENGTDEFIFFVAFPLR